MSGNTDVLIVEDEAPIAELYAIWLGEEYDVEIAANGTEGLDRLDDDVDVVLLDRRMPGLSGDEVLTRIRERGLACRVAMVTAVDPDFDVLEMPFDDYLVKPVTRDELYDVVEGLLDRKEYTSGVREYFAVASKLAALESAKPRAELDGDDRYLDLVEQKTDLQGRVDQTFEEHDEFVNAFRDISNQRDPPYPGQE